MKKVRKRNVGSSLPLDLMMEIFKRLPVKTLTKFLSVSKLWASIIRDPDFRKLFLNESLNRPRGLVLLYNGTDKYFCYSSEHRRFSTHKTSSSSIASLSTYHVTCHKRQHVTFIAPSVHGLLCYGFASRVAIYNPCTRRSITLPKLDLGSTQKHIKKYYLGYDPMDNEYKVLCVKASIPKSCNTRGLAIEVWFFTLGSGSSWKMIQNTPPHSPKIQDLCINGVLYYRAFTGKKLKNSAIMRFDVRSEKLDLIKAEKLDLVQGPRISRTFSKLTSYEGKLGVIFLEKENIHTSNVALWVLEDAAKEEWSMKPFVLPVLPSSLFPDMFQKFHSTDTNTGEIIFSEYNKRESPSFSVAYCDLKGSRVRRVDIEEIPEGCGVDSVSYGQVENLMFL